MLDLHGFYALREIRRGAAHQNLLANLKLAIQLQGHNSGFAKIRIYAPDFLRLAVLC
jgi:hypothetical protein